MAILDKETEIYVHEASLEADFARCDFFYLEKVLKTYGERARDYFLKRNVYFDAYVSSELENDEFLLYQIEAQSKRKLYCKARLIVSRYAQEIKACKKAVRFKGKIQELALINGEVDLKLDIYIVQ